MEDNVQRVFAILISVIIFFFLPMYIAYEKKDDISYALALKITNNFVENVTNKGYLSKEMYDNFVNELAATDNVYDIKLEHVAKRYYPVIVGYDNNDKIIEKFDASLYKIQDATTIMKVSDGGKHTNSNVKKYELSYDLKEERYNQTQILETIYDINTKPLNLCGANNEEYQNLNLKYVPISYGKEVSPGTYDNIYSMSTGDEFNVIIRNTNTTIGASMFNTFTFAGEAGVPSRV